MAKRAAGGGLACRCGAWALVGNRALRLVLGVSTRQFGVGGFSGVGGRGALATVEVPLPAVSGRSGEWPRRRERGVLATCDLILHGSLFCRTVRGPRGHGEGWSSGTDPSFTVSWHARPAADLRAAAGCARCGEMDQTARPTRTAIVFFLYLDRLGTRVLSVRA